MPDSLDCASKQMAILAKQASPVKDAVTRSDLDISLTGRVTRLEMPFHLRRSFLLCHPRMSTCLLVPLPGSFVL